MFEVKFADIGEGIHEGVLYKWLVDQDEQIAEGQGLFMVETDKVTAEIPSPVSGTIKVMNAKVGETIHVGQTIVAIETLDSPSTSDLDSAPKVEQGSTSVVGEIEVSSAIIPASRELAEGQDGLGIQSQKVLATPVARQLAKDLNVDIKLLKGTGPNGRVMKEDITRFAEQSKPVKPSQPMKKSDDNNLYDNHDNSEKVQRVKLSMRRKSIAKNMVASKAAIPHAAAMDEIDVTALVDYRKKHKDQLRDLGYKLTYLPFIVKAVVLALKENPILNASLDESAEEIVLKQDYNIGIAVDDEDGLLVPVIHHADNLSILECANSLERLIKRIAEKQISISDLQHGTFTITNYGTVGALFGVPVIRYPEAAILGVGTIQRKPVVIGDEVVIRDILPITIAFDHRIIDGGDAGRFLLSLKRYLSNIDLLLLN